MKIKKNLKSRTGLVCSKVDTTSTVVVTCNPPEIFCPIPVAFHLCGGYWVLQIKVARPSMDRLKPWHRNGEGLGIKRKSWIVPSL